MQTLRHLGTFILIMGISTSCKKEIPQNSNTASITIVNAIENANDIVVNFSDSILPYYTNQSPISYASSNEYGVSAAMTNLIVVSSIDTGNALTTMSLNLKAGGIYSLYMAGSGNPQTPADAVFLQDTIPNYLDSVAGIRFINLSPGSGPMTVNKQGNNPGQTEFSNINYKQITAFKSYPDTNGISSYTFEVRDQATGNLLNTFNWSFNLFKSNTLVICGSEDPSSITPIGVFQVNNF